MSPAKTQIEKTVYAKLQFVSQYLIPNPSIAFMESWTAADNDYLPRVSQTRLSANDQGDGLKPKAMNRSPGICLTTEETPETSASRPSESCVTIHCLKQRSLPPNDIKERYEEEEEHLQARTRA